MYEEDKDEEEGKEENDEDKVEDDEEEEKKNCGTNIVRGQYYWPILASRRFTGISQKYVWDPLESVLHYTEHKLIFQL